MNAVAQISFDSAYRQLMPAEKAYVDTYVAALETASERAKESIRTALARPVPAEVIEASKGMLDRPMIRAAIRELVEEIASASELNVRRVLKNVNAIAFSSVEHFMDIREDGKPNVDFSKATPAQLLAVKSFEYREDLRLGKREMKFTLHDKPTALYKYMEMFGLLEPDNPHIRLYSQAPKQTGAGSAVTSNAAETYARMLQSGALA